MRPESLHLALEEYRALRATIRQRGTARLVIAPHIFVVWGLFAIALQIEQTLALWTLIPLIVLAAGFEAVFSLHVGVERIGRYLQVYYEDESQGAPAWEHLAMRPTAALPAVGIDPLFGLFFGVAAVVNLAGGVMLATAEASSVVGIGGLFLILGICHGAFGARLWRARRFAATQRARDLERFKSL
jgi:hypothetical protein